MPRWVYLRGGAASLLIDARPGGDALPRIVHFGADLGATPDFESVAARSRVLWGARMDQPRPACVLPGAEAGYFGMPALEPQRQNQWRLEAVEATSDGVTLRFPFACIDYRMSPQGVLASRVRVTAGEMRQLASMAMPLPVSASEVLSFGGDWAREFSPQRQTLDTGALVFESRRGRPGHDRFPGLFVGERGFGDDHGGVNAFTLGWSGSYRIVVERLREGPLVVQAGELQVEDDRVGAGYESPWCYATYAPNGLNGAMQTLHAFVREHVAPKSVAAKPRPVHYNTWEAVYFKHDVATLKELADHAATVGAERFVLDDGWFKGRNNDHSSLGDWVVDGSKYPDGLKPLVDHVRAKGLEFGLWVEPEMVNPDSDLARAHPDWVRREGATLLLMRNQAVLDVAREDVRAHLFDALHALLSAHPISYLKWDMNRDVTGAGHGAYVRAVHALIDRLRATHPTVEIETCASGGGRCDYAMLSRAERVWVSDSNDALDRFDIQRNANLFLPPEVAGVHVGPAACHTTGRRLSLDLRAHVAMFGHMGLELDLRELSADDAARLAAHIANYKRFRSLVHSGRYWRRTLDQDHAAVCVTSGDEALALVVRHGSAALGRGTLMKMPGLAPDATYRVEAVAPVSKSVEASLAPPLTLSGRVLEGRGIEFYLPRPESSLLLHAKRV